MMAGLSSALFGWAAEPARKERKAVRHRRSDGNRDMILWYLVGEGGR